MRTILLLILLPSFIANAQVKTSFATLQFDKVVMYDFEGGKGEEAQSIVEQGKLANTISKKVVLTSSETRMLTSKLTQRSSYGGASAACFDPHLGFVFFSNDKIVAWVTICLDCNRLEPSITVPAQKQGKAGSGKDAYYTGEGMSRSFRKLLNGLLKKYGFSHQVPAGSPFDS